MSVEGKRQMGQPTQQAHLFEFIRPLKKDSTLKVIYVQNCHPIFQSCTVCIVSQTS